LLGDAVAEMKGEPPREEREIRNDLPLKAFIPPEWIGQEALRLELYRRIGTARDREELDVVRAEAEDRFGVLPPPVLTLFGVASLKLAAVSLGVEEIATFRTQARIKPVPEALGYQLAAESAEATYHATTRTLNLELSQAMGGAELTAWIERALTSNEGPD
jgi:transcription-repair coupling factor (superfamily II helicase)